MTQVTQAEFARRLGVQRNYVTQLKQAGRLVMAEDGLVDAEASEAKIAETADPGKVAVADRHARQRGAAVNLENGQKSGVEPESEGEEEGGEVPATPDYQKARARREQANASLAEIELAERAGELMQTSAVVAVLADAAATCRSMLETIPGVLAPQLAALNDAHECRQLLEEHLGAALNELCDRLAGVQTSIVTQGAHHGQHRPSRVRDPLPAKEPD